MSENPQASSVSTVRLRPRATRTLIRGISGCIRRIQPKAPTSRTWRPPAAERLWTSSIPVRAHQGGRGRGPQNPERPHGLRIGRWYEHRLLLECEAKKRVIRIVESARQTALATMVSDPFEEESRWIPEAIEWTTRSLKALALPYADHPDFEEDWL